MRNLFLFGAFIIVVAYVVIGMHAVTAFVKLEQQHQVRYAR